MCRLLGYATAGFNLSLDTILGERGACAFRDMSRIHNDGWGCAALYDPPETPGVDDGGAPSPETGTKLYKTTVAALYDPLFGELASEPVRGALWHLRLASSDLLPLIMENQQPFFANGLSFIHNGDISDSHGRNIIEDKQYPFNYSTFLSTGGRSDSAIFFSNILEYVAFGYELDEAVAQAVRELRRAYPKASYNCMIQSQDQFIALNAAGRERTSSRIVEIYEEYGEGAKAADYRVMRYRALMDEQGAAAGVVVASSGFDQPEADGWCELSNNQMVVASNRTGEWAIREI